MFLVGDILPMASRKYGNQISVVDHEKRYTFHETCKRMLSLANSLRELGIQIGDRIAIMQTNSYQYMETVLAIAYIGAVYVPINYRLKGSEIEYLLKDSESSYIFIGHRYVPFIESIKNNLKHLHQIICFEGSIPEMLSYEELIFKSEPNEFAVEGLTEKSLFKIQYSSGTTGLPKGTMITHYAAMARINSNIFNTLLSPGDRFYCAGTMFHIAGFGYNLTAWSRGVTTYILDQFDAIKVADLIGSEKLNACFLVPTMIDFILNIPNVQDYNFESLHYIGYGAAPIHANLLKKAINQFNCQFINFYGSSEAGTLSCLMPNDHIIEGSEEELNRLRSVGKPLAYTDIRIVKDDGRDIVPGEVGEIIARSATNMIGYWKLHDATVETLKDGWLHTGDMATIDQEGFIYLVDRKKDMIIRGGENIYPAEIEEILCRREDIIEAAVVGIPDEIWGERVCAFVVLQQNINVSTEDIILYCKKHIASFKCPQIIKIVDQLPRNTMGKVMKKTLRDSFILN